MKKIIVFTLIFFLFSLNVCAESDSYKEQLKSSGADRLIYELDEESRSFFLENDIDISDFGWTNKLSGKNVFSYILGLVTGKAKNPLSVGCGIVCIILITASIASFDINDNRFTATLYAASLAIAVIIANDILEVVSASNSALKGSTVFMVSFVPVFAGITALSGGTLSSASMSALLLGASEVVSFAATFFVLPIMGAYLALNICSGVSPLLESTELSQTIKKIAIWILSFVSTLFLGVLSVQTAVNSSADGVAIKTAKFIVGTSVPVAGPVLSEAVSTIAASVSLLRSSVGIFGIVALSIIFLPIIVELLMFRAVMLVCSSVSSLFSLSKISSLLKAVDMMLALLLGITLLVCGMFIISLTVTVTVIKI